MLISSTNRTAEQEGLQAIQHDDFSRALKKMKITKQMGAYPSVQQADLDWHENMVS